MRKYIILTLVLACISAGGILWAYTDINGQQDDITIKETIEAGKAEATKGIKVSTRILDPTYRLSWDTDMFLDGSGDIKSDTKFVYDRKHEIKFHNVKEDRYQVIDRFSYCNIAYMDLESHLEEDEPIGPDMSKDMLKKAIEAAGDKGKYVWNCNLDDYTSCLPIELYTECIYSDHVMLDTDSDADNRFYSWTEYFQIPVPKDYAYQVEIDRESFDNDMTSVTTRERKDRDSLYEVNSDGFWDGEQLYLAISGVESIGTGRVFAECPAEKRGIHVFPTSTVPYPHLEFDQGKLVYPTDAGEKVINLTQSPDGKTIYLLTKDDNGLSVDIIDKDTYRCRQKVKLSTSFTHTTDFQFSQTGDNWVFYSLDGSEFVLLAEQDGVYNEAVANRAKNLFYVDYMGCDYDGERLAIAIMERDSNVIETQIRVFDKDGCLYRGRFDYSNAHTYYDKEGYAYDYDKRVYVEFTDEI